VIALAGWRKWWHARAQLRDLEERYAALCGQYRAITDAADVLECMVAELRGELAEAQAHLELMSCDNADLERVNAALRDGLQIFYPATRGTAE
jgi:chromosome segregation ATPase